MALEKTPVDFLSDLVSFDTTSSKSNMALIEYMREYLSAHGVESRLVPNRDATKANLWATIGPEQAGGVCLSGHTDVVPVAGQPWDTDPFTLVRQGSRYFGRGTCDMKAFPATALALVPEMVAKPLRRPIHFAFSYDEEVGCAGVPDLIKQVGSILPMPSVVIVGEPTDMKVVSAHKGMWMFRVTVTGKEAHSSQTHRGVSAVMTGARLIAKLGDMAAARAAAADPDCGFVPPYSTIHVGTVSGGTAPNIISRQCAFVCDIRYLPEDEPREIQAEFEQWIADEILPDMQAVAPDSGVEVTTEITVPGLREDRNSAAEAFVRQITGDNGSAYVPYCTEAGQFQEAGMAVVVCGPGSIDQAHQPNEFIEESQIHACEAMLRRVIARCQ